MDKSSKFKGKKMIIISKWDAMDETHACCLSVLKKWQFLGGDSEVSDWVTKECSNCGTKWNKRLWDGKPSKMSPYRVLGYCTNSV